MDCLVFVHILLCLVAIIVRQFPGKTSANRQAQYRGVSCSSSQSCPQRVFTSPPSGCSEPFGRPGNVIGRPFWLRESVADRNAHHAVARRAGARAAAMVRSPVVLTARGARPYTKPVLRRYDRFDCPSCRAIPCGGWLHPTPIVPGGSMPVWYNHAGVSIERRAGPAISQGLCRNYV